MGVADTQGQTEERPLGTIRFGTYWIHDAEYAESHPKKEKKKGWFGGDDESDVEEDEEEEDELQTKTEAEIKKEEEAAKAAKEQLEELQAFEVKSGDYQVQVHIIEVRELKAKDLEGTSDPLVEIECFGQKFCTEVKEKTLSAVFDELFILEKRDVDKEEFEEVRLLRISHLFKRVVHVGYLHTTRLSSKWPSWTRIL